ncbi:MAG TPA: AAA family ATPase [Chitinophagaceae bacterium]|jgi:predicted ATPase
MTKNNFYVITGGPGGGKTSLLNFLASKGYPYVHETAREIIKKRLSQGLSSRPGAADFAQQMFLKDLENYISNSDTTSLLFFDRSFLDSAHLLFNSDMNAYKEIESTHLLHRYNQKVFITPPWKEIYSNDNERDQTFEQAIEVYNHLYNWYEAHQYEVITIPKDTIENRADFILDLITL